MKSTMMDAPLALTTMLERAATLFPQTEIVSRKSDRSLHRCTYQDIWTRARQLAAALLQAGLQGGERVATLMWNHYAHLEAYFGVPLAGGVLHTLNLRLSPDQLAYIVNDAQDRFLIVDDVLLPLLNAFLTQVRVERIFVVPLAGSAPQFENYEDLLASAPSQVAFPAIAEPDAAAMCYTSGTTGEPKAVVYSHRALALHSLAIALPDALGLSQYDAVLPVVPMFHANAWGLPFAATMVGAKQVLPGPCTDALSILELCDGEQVTAAAGVPTVWMGICEQLEKYLVKWKLSPRLRALIGGAAPSEALLRTLAQHAIQVVHAWGMTECAPVATVSRVKPHLMQLSEDEQYAVRATQGTPVPFMELRVMNDAGEVPCDGKTMGEAQLRGPWVAASYYHRADEHDKWTAEGWFRTGDMVTVDAERYVKVVDRAKDLIKSGGEWISSVDLENALVAHPAIKEAAVIAVPHAKWGERPLAIVVAKEKAAVSADELSALLAKKFAKWQLPDEYIFVEQLPHTSTGKLLKSELRKRYRQRGQQQIAS